MENIVTHSLFLLCVAAATTLAGLPICGAAEPLPGSAVAAPGARLEKIAGGFAFTEGPAADPQGNVYFTDQPNDCILKWECGSGKITTFLQPCGRSNGMCFDAHQNLWACADGGNALWRITPSGQSTVVTASYQGKRLNGPNDVWVRPDGGLYITDPFYRREYWSHTQPEQAAEGVYYLPPGGKTLVRVISDFDKPNGIIGTPDGKTLYVADIGAGKTYCYAVNPDGLLTDKHLFCSLGSDGMTIDSEGNVYLTGHGVTVFSAAGTQIAQIPVPEGWTGNLCFGGADRKTLFVTASTGVYTLQMRVHGVGSQ